MYIFCKVVFLTKIDVLSLFLLLIPSIVLRENDVIIELSRNQYGEGGGFHLFIPTLKSAVIIGPLAVSTKLFAAFAVPFRLLRLVNQQTNSILLTCWFVALIISISGLYLGLQQGAYSEGGLTVGVRIVLSLGVMLFPVAINPIEFKYQLSVIMKLSIVFFLAGLMTEHWLFVSLVFPVVILFSNEGIFWKSLSFLMIAMVLTSAVATTFTMKLIPLIAILLLWFYRVKRRDPKGNYKFKMKRIPLILTLFFPMYVVFLTISQKVMPVAQTFASERFLSKLFDDRGLIWTYTIALILKSNVFIVTAGRDIPTFDYWIKGRMDWGAGAHNIFLEIVRQDGLFVFILLFTILIAVFWKLQSRLKFIDNTVKNILIGFIAVYMVYGLTNNPLVYDGIGFLFWLIFSQIIIMSKTNESQ